MDKITAQVGQIIEVNSKQYRATESGFELVEAKRGPLGGELKRLGDCQNRERVFVSALVFYRSCLDFEGVINEDYLVETNIPPRPTFTPMTAGEAARLPDIVGRWVAVKVDEGGGSGPLPLSYGGISGARIYSDCQIMLIEGADL